ncbi:IcmT/TraK family protein [Brucella pituitosa]|uniref:IcmT/TraK family protein n=1 Tax=Brucella pituitosa TaxID=571256 RepID=UPI001C2683BE
MAGNHALLVFPARRALHFVLPLFLFHKRWWTFAVLLVTVLSFAAMRLFQYRPSSAVRAFRSVLAGLCASPWRQQTASWRGLRF